jgi:hypothetical protein
VLPAKVGAVRPRPFFMPLVFWFLSRIGRCGRDRPMPPWLSRSRKKARVVAPFFNSRRSPNSCLGRSHRLRARTRKVGRAEASR